MANGPQTDDVPPHKWEKLDWKWQQYVFCPADCASLDYIKTLKLVCFIPSRLSNQFWCFPANSLTLCPGTDRKRTVSCCCCCSVQPPRLTSDHDSSLRVEPSAGHVTLCSSQCCLCLLFPLSGSGRLSNSAPQGELPVQTLGAQVCCREACQKNRERGREDGRGSSVQAFWWLVKNVTAVFSLYPWLGDVLTKLLNIFGVKNDRYFIGTSKALLCNDLIVHANQNRFL